MGNDGALRRVAKITAVTRGSTTLSAGDCDSAGPGESGELEPTEKELKQQAELLNLTHDAILVRDKDDRILYWNRGAEETYGWPKEEALGKISHDLLRTEFPVPLDEIKADLLRLSGWRGELVHRTRDGSRIVVGSRWALKRDEAGDPQATLEIDRDVTQRRQAEEALQKAHADLEIRVQQRTAALAAEIVERRSAEAQIRARVRQQETIAELGRSALRGMDLALLMDKACSAIVETLKVEYCKVLELSPSGESLFLRAGVGWKEGVVGHATVSAGRDSQAGYTLLRKQPVIAQNLRTESRFKATPLLDDHGVVSGMSVIIQIHERPFGVLGAHTTASRIFNEEDVHFLQAVTNVLAAAIENNTVEQEILRSESWLRNLIATTQDGVVSIDRQGRVVMFNAAAERIFGYAAQEIVGCRVHALMAEPYASEHDAYIRRYERTGEARAIGRIRTVTAKRKSGETFPIELSVTEIEVDHDMHYAAFIRDISEKSRLQKQLVESERLAAISTTAAKIGHELANPLNGMSLTLQLLEQRLGRQAAALDSQTMATLKRLKKEVARLNAILADFRSLSRREEFKFEKTTLTALLSEALEIEMPRYAEQGIQVECSVSSELPSVTADIDKMKQVILNLMKNAAEAMPGGGKISITGSTSGDKITLEIADTGIGIPPALNIFEPFFTTKPQGTGLGLPIVQGIVRAHNGSISYRSEQGNGTIFVLTLPKN